MEFLSELTSVQAAQAQLPCPAGDGLQPAAEQLLNLSWLLIGRKSPPAQPAAAASSSVRSMTSCGAAPAAAAASCRRSPGTSTPLPGAPPAEGDAVRDVIPVTYMNTHTC